MNTRFANQRRQRTPLFIGVGCAVLILIVAPFIFPPVGGVFRTLLRPAVSLGRGIGSGMHAVGAYFSFKQHLENHNHELETENAELKVRLLDRDTLAKENLALQEVLNRKVSQSLTLARVLVKPNRSLYDTLVIDAGKNLHFKEGSRVFAYGDVPLGVIATVDAKTSLVKLYSSPGEVVTGRVEGLNIDITLTGRGGGNFEAELPREVVVSEGTNILLPSTTPLILARFGKEVSDPRDPTQKFILTSPINMSELDIVQVEQES
jgi:cell shape-determining protein MreC